MESIRTIFNIGTGQDCTFVPNEPLPETSSDIYEHNSFVEIMEHLHSSRQIFSEYILSREGTDIIPYLTDIWEAMNQSIDHGLRNEGTLPMYGDLPRKAKFFNRRARYLSKSFAKTTRLFSYSLACCEENAAGQPIVTAPTSSSCGVLPAVLRVTQEVYELDDSFMWSAIAVAGLIGVLTRVLSPKSTRKSGCQCEVGIACAMAAGAVVKLLNGTIEQIENAAAMGLEHHLGMPCHAGIERPHALCFERNAMAASTALAAAQFAMLNNGQHHIPFDNVARHLL